MTIRTTRAATKGLPPALVKRAASLAEQKRIELSARALDDIAFIREKQVEIVANFYDIGVALVRLSKPGIAEAVGRKGLADLCEQDLGISATKARDLINVATLLRREDALRWGQEKSAALIALSKATEVVDSPADLGRKRRLSLGPGQVIDVETSSASEIKRAAKQLRAAKHTNGKPRRGVTVSRDEREISARLERALRDLGIEDARVTVVARPGAEADLRIERVPVSMLAKLGRAVAETRRS